MVESLAHQVTQAPLVSHHSQFLEPLAVPGKFSCHLSHPLSKLLVAFIQFSSVYIGTYASLLLPTTLVFHLNHQLLEEISVFWAQIALYIPMVSKTLY